MERNWTSVGAEYTTVPEDTTEGSDTTASKREELGRVFDSAPWQDVPCSMSFSAGEFIKAASKEFKLGAIKRVFESNKLAPYGLVGIENQFKNGLSRIYFVDEGVGGVPICTDFFPKGE